MDCLLVELFGVGRISIGRGSRDHADIPRVGVAEGEEWDAKRNVEERMEWRARDRKRDSGKGGEEKERKRKGGIGWSCDARETRTNNGCSQPQLLRDRVMIKRGAFVKWKHMNNNDISVDLLGFEYSVSQVVSSNEYKHICRAVLYEFLAKPLSSLIHGLTLKLAEGKVRFIERSMIFPLSILEDPSSFHLTSNRYWGREVGVIAINYNEASDIVKLWGVSVNLFEITNDFPLSVTDSFDLMLIITVCGSLGSQSDHS
ncbi:hypothetical protein HZH68_013613 [Vespula germanica]|uniref:Uncharacterized protein n=1 Tax=Vespula germanica TaxID=30212 RepID=A0A834JDH6_VESGE|nr:hypothetical protein HZH68_013613 [Vespula germanica]